MINTIPITITDRGEVKKDITILAMEFENDSKTLDITLPVALAEKWIYIDFDLPDGSPCQTERLTPIRRGGDCYVLYNVKNTLTPIAGTLKMQVIAKDGDNLVWKSYPTTFTIKSSINATKSIVESNLDVLADLQKQIDEITENSGVSSYNDLTDKPTINGVEITGDITLDELGISGGESSVPIITGGEVGEITIEPNKYYIIDGYRSLTISLSEVSTTELKRYYFEIGTDSTALSVKFPETVELPTEISFAKYTRYLCEIINNKLIIRGEYSNYPYKWLFGGWAISDYTKMITFNSDYTCKYVSGTTTEGTYVSNETNGVINISVSLNDGNYLLFLKEGEALTNNGETYNKLT